MANKQIYICLKNDIIDVDETAYAARYIKYRGFRKCAVWSLGYLRSFRTGFSSFWSSAVTSMDSFFVQKQRKTLQICAAMLNFTQYSYLVFPCVTMVWLTIVPLYYMQLVLPIFLAWYIPVCRHENYLTQLCILIFEMISLSPICYRKEVWCV